MQPLLASFNSHWEPLVWFALGVLGAIGFVAVLHPRRVTALVMREHRWVESTRGATGIEAPASSRFAALVLGRLFGLAVLAAVGAIAYFLAQR
jgi:hypothetical protein